MDLIETVSVTNRRDGRESVAELIRLDAGCVREILILQQEVAGGITVAGSYCALSAAELRVILEGPGLAVGVRAEGRLVAFCTALFPGLRPDNLGRDLGLPQAELGAVAHLEAAVVHPDYRGNALQKKMAGLLVAAIRDAKRWRYVTNTVAPFNIPSLKTTVALGLLIVKLKVKYNEVLRYICCRDLVEPIRIAAGSVIRSDAGDLEGQRKLLAGGYYGFDLENQADGTVILFGKEALQ
jgi:ribosomal protein S18 acetylase RimI-like enzyme